MTKYISFIILSSVIITFVLTKLLKFTDANLLVNFVLYLIVTVSITALLTIFSPTFRKFWHS
ncbi:hypothetical protein [Pediococcus ethanolidurans]|uniref:Uncharacterized protein n=1 Tax=Pediococcus ethanolidurans TaxID=319653 RepID=A0A0R2K1D7_9LACO|nr:hypothetical protein [Pediococcus ethanolidurans]KRN83424.1 hypothetical protein IV87_GL000855 [Pediococcus ethanolidurans]GEN94474.1 hypothetical protein PET01_05240 [Pediococcus ethanolidurans]SER23784.1 hypothetical protein SAMN04487973_10374 [Pediococcus ethanolidurans]